MTKELKIKNSCTTFTYLTFVQKYYLYNTIQNHVNYSQRKLDHASFE